MNHWNIFYVTQIIIIVLHNFKLNEILYNNENKQNQNVTQVINDKFNT